MRLTFHPRRLRRGLHALVFLVLFASVFSFTPRGALASPPLDSPETYVVQSGDTLYAIAIHYDTTIVAIKQLNGLKNDSLAIGQKLLIPSSNGASSPPAPVPVATSAYTVQPGDTLYRIALKFGTTPHALADLNDIPNPNLVSPGQALAIPKSVKLVKPGLIIDPQVARQGGTLYIQVAHPDWVSVKGTFNGKAVPFVKSAGYFYGLVGISRCAKLGNVTLNLTATDVNGETATETATVTIEATAFPVQTITLPPGKGTLLDPTLDAREAEQLAAIVGKYTASRLWSGAFRQPLTGMISANFGTRRSYNGGPVGACGHEGMDLAVPKGTPILSDARGRVVFAGLTQVRGNMVVVDHGVGVFTAYYHQSEMDVKVGQMVEAGALIGKVGTTGLSTGDHLHWSVFVNGEYVDPVEWTRRVLP